MIEELSQEQIARLCRVDRKTISNWLKRYNIPIRSLSKAKHLSRANHCQLSEEAINFINGELLGDGNLSSRSIHSANFRYGSKFLEYIKFISDTLKSFGIEQAGKIRRVIFKNSIWNYYFYESRIYADLLQLYEKWYPNGKKRIPKDIKLTPLTLRQWYIGDGCLHKPKKWGRPYIVLSTNGFPITDVEWLVQKLIKLGLKTTRNPAANVIRISVNSTKDFLDYIGKCPVKCYQYKFTY